MGRFEPSGILTLTTDFGLRDPFVGVMKGRILARFPAARIVDLSHEISTYGPAEAGFWLDRSFEYFPGGTVHLAVVDPGVGTARALLCVAARGHLLLAPDNGLLAALIARIPGALIVRLTTAGLARLGIEAVSATFHGRDIFAPVGAALAAGQCAPGDLGEEVGEVVPSTLPAASVRGATVHGTVVTIDHFGNLITNIDQALLQRFRSPLVLVGERSLHLGVTYGAAAAGEYLALVNSFGVLEVARVQASAAAGLGLARGAAVAVREADAAAA